MDLQDLLESLPVPDRLLSRSNSGLFPISHASPTGHSTKTHQPLRPNRTDSSPPNLSLLDLGSAAAVLRRSTRTPPAQPAAPPAPRHTARREGLRKRETSLSKPGKRAKSDSRDHSLTNTSKGESKQHRPRSGRPETLRGTTLQEPPTCQQTNPVTRPPC